MRDTQRAAFEAINPCLSDKRKVVFDAVAAAKDGLTLFEICEILHWPINSVSGRVTELSNLGWVRDSGRRRLNPHSGKAGIVWEALDVKVKFDEEGQSYFA